MVEPWILAEREAQHAYRDGQFRPVCVDCGRRITEPWALWLDAGEYVCEKCARLRVVEL